MLATTGQLTATTTLPLSRGELPIIWSAQLRQRCHVFFRPAAPSSPASRETEIVPVGSSVTFSVSAINFFVFVVSNGRRTARTSITPPPLRSISATSNLPTPPIIPPLVTSPFEGGYQISSEPGYLRVGGYPAADAAIDCQQRQLRFSRGRCILRLTICKPRRRSLRPIGIILRPRPRPPTTPSPPSFPSPAVPTFFTDCNIRERDAALTWAARLAFLSDKNFIVRPTLL